MKDDWEIIGFETIGNSLDLTDGDGHLWTCAHCHKPIE
jgi:hypothetical protein